MTTRGEARVLVVEDDAMIRAFLAELLRGPGYAIRAAANGVRGLAAMRDWRPDAVLLDLMMPEMDGWQVRRAMLDDPALARIPVVLMSATHADSLHLIADELDTPFVLTKPFDLVDLERALGAALAAGATA